MTFRRLRQVALLALLVGAAFLFAPPARSVRAQESRASPPDQFDAVRLEAAGPDMRLKDSTTRGGKVKARQNRVHAPPAPDPFSEAIVVIGGLMKA